MAVVAAEEEAGAAASPPPTPPASLGLSRRFLDRYSFSVDAGYARGVAQTSANDLNLDATPEFTLANEGNRPVYAPAADIVPATGAVSLLGSRRFPHR